MRGKKGFTLIETLVVMTIVALLLATLLPALRGVRGRMHSLKCASNLRTVTIEFQLFAEGNSAKGRGDSDRRSGRGFYIDDFQESVYRIHEFWDLPNDARAVMDRGAEPMICPTGSFPLERRKGYPCGRDSLTPIENVTLAVNMRLYQAPTVVRNRPALAPWSTTRVRSDVLNYPYVPLVLDVDARTAQARNLQPFYIAPPRLMAGDPYKRHWMPGRPHGGKTNVAFVGGHVLSSTHAEDEPWDWGYAASYND